VRSTGVLFLPERVRLPPSGSMGVDVWLHAVKEIRNTRARESSVFCWGIGSPVVDDEGLKGGWMPRVADAGRARQTRGIVTTERDNNDEK
jgi:hypothetical protein